jgi:hypothetical protein
MVSSSRWRSDHRERLEVDPHWAIANPGKRMWRKLRIANAHENLASTRDAIEGFARTERGMPIALPRAMKMRSLSLILVLVAACSATSDDENVTTTDEDLSNAQATAFHFFVNKGLTRYQAAGIVGNLIQESSVIPTAKQFGGGPGRGIAQWSVGGRWDSSHHDNMVWFANQHGLSRWSLHAQLEFIWYELDGVGGYGLHALRTSDNVTEATIAFERDFEICGGCDQSKRIAYAKQVLNAF